MKGRAGVLFLIVSVAAYLVSGAERAAALSLDPPGSLAATGVSPSRVDLTWQDTNTNESGHRVERSLSAFSGFVEIAVLA